MKKTKNKLLITLTLFIIPILFLLPSVNAELVMHWTMNNTDLLNATVINDFAGEDNNNGTLINNVVTGVPGIIGESFSFNGASEYIDMNNNGFSDEVDFSVVSTAFTISMWVKQDIQQGDRTLIAKQESATDRAFVLATEGIDNDIKYRVFFADSAVSNADRVTATGTATSGDWIHVAVTYNASDPDDVDTRLQIFINGTKQSVPGGSIPVTFRSNTADWWVGQFQNIRFWNGDIDDICMYNETLSSANISNIYNSGIAGKSCTNLIPQVPATIPPSIELVSPLNNAFFMSNNISIQYIIDLDVTANVSSIAYFVNDTLVKNITTNQNDTIIVPDGFNSFNVTVQDTNGKESNKGIDIFTVDTINPISDLAVALPTASTFFIDEPVILVTADNVNLANHSVFIFDSTDTEVYTQKHTNIGSNMDVLNISIDISVLGAGTFIAISNQSDIGGLTSSDSTTFTILEPTAPSITCDFGAGQTTCAATEDDVIQQLGAVCNFATSTTFTLRNQTNNSNLDTGAGINSSSSVWVFDNIDTSLSVINVNVSTICTNDAGSKQSDLVFAVTPLEQPAEQIAGSGIITVAASGASMLIFVIIILGVVGFGSKRRFTRGGKI